MRTTMRTTTAASMLAFSLIVLLASCSSAPGPEEEVTAKRRKAAEYSEYGNNYYNQGMYGKALELYELALAYNGAADYRPGIVRSYNALGKTYLALGRLEEAASRFDRALRMALELDDPRLICRSLNNRGELELRREDFEAGLDLFRRAEERFERGVPDPDRAIVYNNMGTGYKRLGKPGRALEFFQRALELNERERLAEEAATNCFMIASVLSEQGEYDQALEYAERALDWDKKVENSLGIAKDYLALGLISKRVARYEEAFGYFESGLFVYRSLAVLHSGLNIEADVKKMLRELIETAELLGRTSEAEVYRGILEGEGE